jgi:hypothetical protein
VAGKARWADELGEPVTVADCGRLVDTQGVASMLTCSFHRAGRSHAVLMSVDHLDCGAAGEILLLAADQLPEALVIARADARALGLDITNEVLQPAEFRWQIENAMRARAVHDSDDLDLRTEVEPIDEDGLLDYRAMAVLMRTRMAALPLSKKPPVPHTEGDGGDAGRTVLDMLAKLAGKGGGTFDAGTPLLPQRGAMVAKLPAKRKKSAGPAPVYQLKVGLRGAKPPIWRRLEVSADISLARLHDVIQVAFEWDDSHLHVFETPYGEFGAADADLGHRAEAPVTLEQVAPDAASKIRYTYDFGDDWEHDILVEKVLDRDKAASYPRCTGGRRAAPPENCGGIWGYAELAEILADPDHPEHEGRPEWLGLDDAAQFDPTAFDAKEVTQDLSDLG